MGIVGVERYGDCARYYYTIDYHTLAGDVAQIQANDIFKILIQCIYLLITISRLNLNF